MEQITAIIERAADGTYSVYCKDEIFSGMGETIEDAKADMARQMAIYKETAVTEGFKYPEFLDGEYIIDYSIDALSLMIYYINAGIFSLAALEKITGINQKQLCGFFAPINKLLVLLVRFSHKGQATRNGTLRLLFFNSFIKTFSDISIFRAVIYTKSRGIRKEYPVFSVKVDALPYLIFDEKTPHASAPIRVEKRW